MAQLIDVQLSPDRTRLRLRLRDAAGQAVLLTLPSTCLNTILAVLPRDVEARTVHHLDAWAINVAENGEDLILALRTPEGRAVSFRTKPSQVQGMATIATYGRNTRHPTGTIH